MWTTLPDNGPLSDVVVRTTPCAGQVGVHRPEHQVELAGVQGGQRHELTLKPPRLDGHERWPPLVVGAGGVAVVSFGLHQHRPGKPQLSLRAYGMVGGGVTDRSRRRSRRSWTSP